MEFNKKKEKQHSEHNPLRNPNVAKSTIPVFQFYRRKS